MIETDYETFLRGTAGRYTVLGTVLVWCSSPTLCGVVMWDAPRAEDTVPLLHILDQYPHQMASAFDIVLDSREVSRVDPGALAHLFGWLVARRTHLAQRLRLQANVIREGPVAFTLTGLLPLADWPIPSRFFTDPVDAFRATAGEEGPEFAREVDRIVQRHRGVARELLVTREMLSRSLDATIEEVSRALATSPRSLQRILRRHGTSFRDEVTDARFVRAQELLASTDEKIASVAARVGTSERALTTLFRKKAGTTPAEWRRGRRGA
ncbi:MAG: helix-turn-helix domain-containing protein [Sandaracinaceae bacterium]